MNQFPSPAQASRKYFYFFISLISLVVLMDLAGGVRSVDSKRSAAEAKEKEQRELEKALFVNRVVRPPQPVSPQNSAAPVSPLSCGAVVSNTVTCTNSTAITAADSSQGSPYPSTITVAGLTGNVTNVKLTLIQVNSANNLPGVQLLLQGPNGTRLVFLAGDAVGDGGTALVNSSITIDDTQPQRACNGNQAIANAAVSFPATVCGGVGTSPINGFPTVCTPFTSCPRAQPQGGASGPSTTMARFNSEPSGNGNWSLYTVNNGGIGNTGAYSFNGGWSITVTSSGAAATATTTAVSPANTSVTRTPPSASNPATITATVDTSPHSAINAGTGSFFDNGNALSCNAGSNTTVTNNVATCILTFTQEGIHPITASYGGASGFAPSNSPANTPANITVTNNTTTTNHSTTGGTYCNVGSILIPSSGTTAGPAAPYPSQIFVGSNGGTALPGVITNLTVDLKAIHHTNPNASQLLLVSPNNTAYILFSDAYTSGGSQGPANITLSDAGGSQIPNSGGFSTGTFRPADYHTNASEDEGVFTPPAPQSGFLFPNPIGSGLPAGPSTIGQAFNGAGATGTWQLFVFSNSTGSSGAIDTGWCLNFTVNPNLHASTSTNSASPVSSYTTSPFTSKFPPVPANDFVTFTAHITSDILVSTGSVTFTENGSNITCGNGTTNPAAVNGSGDAICKTTFTTEGNHIIKATYHDAGGMFGDSNGNALERADSHSTRSPAANVVSNTTTYNYCNPGQIRLPAFSVAAGPGNPYPSNIFINDLPGTINKVTLSIPDLQANNAAMRYLTSMLVGNNQVIGDSFDLFTHVGQLSGFASPINITLDDAAGSHFNQTSDPTTGTWLPTSFNLPSAATYPSLSPAGPYPPPVGTPQYASPTGATTFASVYGSGSGNTRLGAGTWSLFQQMILNSNPIFEGNGTSVSSWCLNFTINPPVLAITNSHGGAAVHFRQGDTADTYTVHVTNNGPGPTGGLVMVTENAPAGLTVTGMSGTGWTCTTLPNCTSSDVIASGSSYPDITVTVSVACNAGTPLSNTASVQGGGAVGIVISSGDSTTVDVVAADGSGTLTVPATTVLAGAASPNLTFTYTAAAGGLNNGEIDITIPAGWSGGTATTNNGSATITAGVIKVTGIVTPATAGSTVTIGYNGATVTSTAGTSTFSTTERSGCTLTALASSPSVTVTNLDTWTGTGDTNWNTAGNWSPGPAPGAINDVSIPNLANKPIISASDITVNSLTLASSSTLTINSGRTLNINVGAANSNASVDGQILGSGAVQFGSGSHNLSGAGSFASTIVTTLVSGATFNLTSNMQMGSVIINGGATMNLVGHTLSLSGTPTPLTISGTFNTLPSPGDGTNAASPNAPESVGGTVLFNGGAAQNAPGIPYNGLTISNASGVTLSGNATVNIALTLTSGDLNTGAFTLTMPATASSQGTGDVVGNVKRTGVSTVACPSPPCANTLSFGEPDNQITMTAGTTPTDITVNLVKSAPVGFSSAVQRTYTITPNPANLSGFTAIVRLHYLDAELNGNTPESSLSLRRFNGTGWAPYAATTPVDTVNNWVQNNAVQNFSPWTFSKLSPTAAQGTIGGSIADGNGNPVEGAVVRLSGDQSRKTITDANGNYHFDNVDAEAFYTVTPSRANYNFNPFNHSFSQIGNRTDAVFTANSTGDSVNPLDTAEYFVRQQYVDVLGREPDETGFNYWSDQLLACSSDAACSRSRRTSVAGAFFIEQEAQQTASFIYDVYAGTLRRKPVYSEYNDDRQQVVGGATLDAAKTTYAQSFVQRAEFMNRYQGAMTAESFVDALLQSVQSSGVDLSSERANLIGTYNLSSDLITSRAAVVRWLADNPALKQSRYNRAFVLTEYFAYLRRDIDQGGYDFWVNVLSNGDIGNYRGMVCSFITSAEYQQRFSQVVTRSNGECTR